MRGSEDRDTITGTRQQDTIYGYGSDDYLTGDRATVRHQVNHILNGAADTIYGGDSENPETYLSDFDTIWGDGYVEADLHAKVYGGNDKLYGQRGRDFMYGDGAAWTGGEGDAVLVGGDDLLAGGGGNDEIWGHGWAGILDGDGGTVTFKGGNDRIVGGKGDDTLWGEGHTPLASENYTAGADTFVFRKNHGNDTIMDLDEKDKIDLSAYDLRWRDLDTNRDGRLTLRDKHLSYGGDEWNETVSLNLTGAAGEDDGTDPYWDSITFRGDQRMTAEDFILG